MKQLNQSKNNGTNPRTVTKTDKTNEAVSIDELINYAAKSPHDIFDRVFKICLSLSAKAVIGMINGLFDTDYPLNSKVTYNWTEFEDHGTLRKILADTIITINEAEAYHFEAQIEDDDIVLRVFEYGFMHGIRGMKKMTNSETGESFYEMQYPRQMVIYLDEAKRIPDDYAVRIRFQNQGTFTYHIPVIRFQQETIEDIKKKHLIILLPFKLLSLRKDFEKEQSKENIERLLKLYRNDIIDLVDGAYEAGEIDSKDRLDILSLTRKLLEHLYQKYDEVWKVITIMRDQSLTLDTDVYRFALEEKEMKIDQMQEQINNQKAEILALQEEIAKLKAANETAN